MGPGNKNDCSYSLFRYCSNTSTEASTHLCFPVIEQQPQNQDARVGTRSIEHESHIVQTGPIALQLDPLDTHYIMSHLKPTHPSRPKRFLEPLSTTTASSSPSPSPSPRSSKISRPSSEPPTYSSNILQGDVNALFALSPIAKPDVRDFVTGEVKARAKVGHELIKPTGRKVVFVLRMEDEGNKAEIGEEGRQGLMEWLCGDEDVEGLEEEGAGRPDEAEKQDRDVGLMTFDQEVDQDLLQLFSSPDEVDVTDRAEEPSHQDILTLLATTENDDSKRPRLPRTSNGPSLASLIASTTDSDFEPDAASFASDPLPPRPSTPEPYQIRCSSEGPSLAALIASAEPDDFPLADAEFDFEPPADVESGFEAEEIYAMCTGAAAPRIYDYTYKFAFIVIRERFEARNEGEDGHGARAWLRKRNGEERSESKLRWEVVSAVLCLILNLPD